MPTFVQDEEHPEDTYRRWRQSRASGQPLDISDEQRKNFEARWEREMKEYAERIREDRRNRPKPWLICENGENLVASPPVSLPPGFKIRGRE